MQKSHNTQKPMSKSASLMHTTVYAAIVGAACVFRVHHGLHDCNDKCRSFGLRRLFEITDIPSKGMDRGLKKCFEGFFNHNSSCECKHAAISDDMQLDQPWLLRKKCFQAFFRPNCIESMVREGLTAPISPWLLRKSASRPFLEQIALNRWRGRISDG